MKLESDKRVVCDGSCSECLRRLRLYICDAVDCGGISAWRTWLGSRIALPNSSSLSAMLHSSSNVANEAQIIISEVVVNVCHIDWCCFIILVTWSHLFSEAK